jgi:hypothetical protein
MTVFPEFERDLYDAARRRLTSQPNQGSAPDSDVREPGRRSRGAGRVRRIAVAVGCLLATTTVALAATGVILTGAPVRPEATLNPNVGLGIPAPGSSQLLTLRVPDPEGGLPWGMRVVRTTRGEVCLQVARVLGAKLGALGVDGEFHDDGRFHPISPQALPADVFHGHAFDTMLGNANTNCALDGEARVSRQIGIDRGAGPNPHHLRRPLRELRNIYFGLLGAHALSITYKAGKQLRTIPVLPGLGAYLIIGRTHRHQQVESGDTGLGTEGDLGPMPPLTAITYRLGGQVCERVQNDPFAPPSHVEHPCPFPHFPQSGPPKYRNLHLPIHLSLRTHDHLIISAHVSFVAPFAVTSAREHYVLEIPRAGSCPGDRPGVTGGGLETTAQNVKAGAVLGFTLPAGALFSTDCNRHLVLPRSSAALTVFYEPSPHRRMVIGSTTARRPNGGHIAR